MYTSIIHKCILHFLEIETNAMNNIQQPYMLIYIS